jgi:hypothetical protein
MPRKTTETTSTPKKTTTRRVTARRRKTTDVTHDHIATRAYFLHLEGGGDATANWLQAERELVAV